MRRDESGDNMDVVEEETAVTSRRGGRRRRRASVHRYGQRAETALHICRHRRRGVGACEYGAQVGAAFTSPRRLTRSTCGVRSVVHASASACCLVIRRWYELAVPMHHTRFRFLGCRNCCCRRRHLTFAGNNSDRESRRFQLFSNFD